MCRYEEREGRILKSLIERRGMQHIMDTAAEVFGNPVFVCDLGYKIVCYSHRDDPVDDFWSSMKEHRYSLPEQIAQIVRTGDFERIYSMDEPRIGRYAFAAHPFLAARVQDGGRVMGHVCVYAASAPLREEDGELLALLCKVVSYEMLYRGISSPCEIPYYTLMVDLLEGALTEPQELQMRLECLNLTLPKSMRLLLMDFKSAAVQPAIYYIRESLLRQAPRALSIVYKEQLVLLAPEDILTSRLFEEGLSGYEANLDYRIGVSDPFEALDDLRIYYGQAADAIRISDMLKLEGRLCQYSRLKVYQLLIHAGRETDLKFLCDPVVLKMRAYDAQYHTEYLRDLELYLGCGKNINQTAQKACVHKNSMYYRISRMEDLFGLSLDDEEACFSLRLSLKILRLIDR